MKAQTKQTIKIYWRHVLKHKWQLFWIIVTLMIANVGLVIRPFIYKGIFNLLAGGFNGASSRATFLHLLGLLLIAHLVFWTGWRITTFINNRFQSRMKSDLNNSCFDYLHDHSFAFFTNNFSGSLVRKVNRFDRSFEDIADQISFGLGPIVLVTIAIVIILFFQKPLFGWVALIWTVVYTIFSYFTASYRNKFDLRRTEMDSVVTGRLADTVNNNLNLKLFSAKSYELEAFKGLTEKLYWVRLKSWDIAAIFEAAQAALMFMLEFAILYFAYRYWREGQLTVGDLALLQGYLFQLFDWLWNLSRSIRKLYENFAEANEMTEIFMTPHEVQDLPGAAELAVSRGQIDFVDVNFGYYADRKVFDNFNLNIKAGEKLAVIGPSGGGKTTFVKMLLRFMDIQSGKILIDGQNIASVTQDSLRQAIAMVPQEPILFHRTLMENIRYARQQASEDEVIQAAKLAHCHEFISQFPQGYDTYVGERGIKLSGGERQRVAIARAILKNAPILVLDEATSSLDSESEHLIQDALRNLMHDKTAVVIAHRLSTIMQMDRIIVLDKGKIAEEGSHQNLLKIKKGTYQKLWEIQAGGFAA